mgnify:CR=1 FL=1
MRKTFCLLLGASGIFCLAQKQFQPAGSTILETVDGDLDGDKIPEKVMIYTTKDEGEIGKIREIQILKKVNGKWTILEKSRNAVMESSAGGMMGDPYQSTGIEKGILTIIQAGGSSWKWDVTDKYRFQNGHFELIGTSTSSGRPGDYWKDIDFNLSTGQLNYSKEVENMKFSLESVEAQVYKKESEKSSLESQIENLKKNI